MSEVDKAIEELKKQYALAEGQEHVNDALCYALYQTWKKFDVERKNKKRKTRAYKACEECAYLSDERTSVGSFANVPEKNGKPECQ